MRLSAINTPLRAVAAVAAFLVLLAAALYFGVTQWLAAPLPLPQTPYEFEVKSGASLSTVARELTVAGVLPHRLALVLLARLHGQDRAIKAGRYEFAAGTTLPGLLATLTQGDVTQTSVTFIEGSTFADVKRLLRAEANVKNTVLDLPDDQLMARIGFAGIAPEGRFFPDTYFFAAGATDASLLKRAYRTMADRLQSGWEQRAPNLPLATPEEALILASIVEKETGRAADRPLIASVFVNRLRRGMRLQTDPTVIYGLGERFNGNLTRRDLTTDTRWNTYTRDGLPPTPIAMPSQASLDAVMRPPASDYLYFVARGDGASQFSKGLDEHNRAVAKYQRGGR